MRKKCSICKLYFDIENPNQEDYIYIHKSNKFCHYDCILKEELKKQTTKKRGILTKEKIEDKLKDVYNDNLIYIKHIFDEQKLFDFIHNSYNIVSIPSILKFKLNEIYNGNYKGLSRGVMAEDILDMWQRKKQDLDKINNYNKQKGKELDKAARLNYDLAILMSKYDSFLEWKEKEKIRGQIEIKSLTDNVNYNKIDYTKIKTKPLQENKKIDDFFDIEDILNEI